MIIKNRLLFILLFTWLFLSCESLQDTQQSTSPQKLSNLEQLVNRSKSALIFKMFSIIQANPDSLKSSITRLPSSKCYLRNLSTNEIIENTYTYEGLNIFLNIPPGQYQIYQLEYDDVLSFPILSSLFKTLDDKKISLKIIELKDYKHPLYINIKARKYQYAGDMTIVLTKKGVRYSSFIQENKNRDMRIASELIISKFPHSKWAKKALDYLGIENEN